MINLSSQDLVERPADNASENKVPALAAPVTALLSGAMLAACGGGGAARAPGPLAPPFTREPVTPERAARFLAQASMGATREQIAMVQSLGYAAWIDEQFALPPSRTRWDYLAGAGYQSPANLTTDNGADACQWRKLLLSHDTLRQRVTLALSEIVVTSVAGVNIGGWGGFATAAYLDLLEANAFGNYRDVLQQVSLSVPMGDYLSYRGNAKFDPVSGAMPDENYARELLQLFTIGLLELNLDGTPKLRDGMPIETYTQSDVIGLARVFTGWDYDLTGSGVDTPEFKRRPLIQVAERHESGSKSFLGHTIGAGTDGAASLTKALDAIFAHPNVGPFISRQLIQRLVCSNPSRSYLTRVATVFNNNGLGVKGDLKAVIKAILLDDEARTGANLGKPGFGKLREPILRLCAWARAFGVASPSDTWAFGDTSDPTLRLGQSPLRARSVFNFFRPGYVPHNSALARAGLVAPEFQIANESTVIAYVNFIQSMIVNGAADAKPDYGALMPLADNAGVLLAEINLLLAAGQLSAPTMALMRTALDSMASGNDPARLNRIYCALVMIMASPEFLVQK